MYYSGLTSFKHKCIACGSLHIDLTVIIVLAQLLAKIGRIIILQAPFRKPILIWDQIA